jgi:hypothetical protein
MRTLMVAIGLLASLSVGSTARAETTVFFEEQFSGPTLDSSIWRTEILTSGPRWCDTNPGQGGGPGVWVDEGSECYGVAAYSPYGTALLSDGLLQVSSDNGQACPYLVSRIPGPVQPFPPAGDFTAKVRMRYDRLTPWGCGIVIFQIDNTEPVGTNPPGTPDVLMMLWGEEIDTSLGGTFETVATMPPPYEMHEFELECVGNSYTISVDGQVVYGPVTSTLRPTAVAIGNAVLAYWYPTDWQEFSVDYIRVEVPGPVPVAGRTWGSLKEMYRD